MSEILTLIAGSFAIGFLFTFAVMILSTVFKKNTVFKKTRCNISRYATASDTFTRPFFCEQQELMAWRQARQTQFEETPNIR